MNKKYDLIFQELFSKLDLINTSNQIKDLYRQKIELLELEFKRYIYLSLDKQTIIDKINLLDQELNQLIITSNKDELAMNSFTNDKISNYQKENKQSKINASKIKTKFITYLLTLSIMLSSSILLIDREKNKTKEVLYKTDTYTYYDDLNLYPNNSEYLAKTDIQGLLIQRISPWHIEGIQGKRTIDTYQINSMDINGIIRPNSFGEILSNLDYTSENEYKYKNELRDYDRYEEPIYRVIYKTQDESDYITRYPNINAKIIALLFTNILIYMLMFNINKGPLLESLITNIHELNTSKKNIDIDYKIIKVLRKQKN